MKSQYLISAATASLLILTSTPAALAQNNQQKPLTRSWEAVPSVIRSNGRDSFQLKVAVSAPVNAVYIEEGSVSPYLVAPASLELRDDGVDGDEFAGDGIYTSGKFHYNTAYLLPQHYMHSADSPAGLYSTSIGMVTFEEVDGRVSDFLLNPEVGLLHRDIPAVSTQVHNEKVAASAHLINVASDERATQNYLRLYPGSGLTGLTQEIYRVLPDAFDFLVFFSNDKIESVPHQTSTANYHAGMHSSIQVNYSGTGNKQFDYSHLYGSRGRLLGVNALDTFSRGINSDNAVHELLHQWSAALNKSFGLDDHRGHYNPRSNIGSVLGAVYPWIDNNDGSYTIDCERAKKGLTDAAPLDKYLMGLIDGREVPTLRAYKNSKPHPDDLCRRGEQDIHAEDIAVEVSIEDIQSQHGVRTPGPADAQRDFNIGFVVESHGRFLNATEMTYYSLMAAHFTREIPARHAAPAVSTRNWVSISRYFGEGSRWSSAIAGREQVAVASPTPAPRATAAPARNATSNPTQGSTVSLRGSLAVSELARRAVTKNPVAASTATSKVTVAKASAQQDSTKQVSTLQKMAAQAVVVATKSLYVEAENFASMSGVSIKNGSEIGQHSGAVVGAIDPDDWLKYSVNIETAGTYTIEYRVASSSNEGFFALDSAPAQANSSEKILDNVKVPATGGAMKWQTISRTVTLEKGRQYLGIYVYGGDFNLDWIRLSKI